MNEAGQNELPLFKSEQDANAHVGYLLQLLQTRDWTKADDLIVLTLTMTGVEWSKRKLRELAALSKGQVAGGQLGYKLVKRMTADEFHHWRHWMTGQAMEMQRRVIDADRIFYGRETVPNANGIL